MTDDCIYPIEIKKTASPTDADKNFEVLNKNNYQIKPGLNICMAEKLVQNENKNWFVPVSML